MIAALKQRLDIVPAQRRPRNVLFGAIVIVVAVLALFSAVTHDIPFLNGKPGYELRAEVAGANQVNGRTPVRVAGVDVGKVDQVVAGSRPGTSLIKMRITQEGLQVKRDARADIRWRTLLGGNMYVDLQPGSPSAPELGDAPIALANTSSQVEFDDLTQVFDGPTADAQRTVLRELRDGFSDPEATGRSIVKLGPGLRAVALGTSPLQGTEQGDLRRLVAATGRTLRGLGQDTTALQELIVGADRTLAVTDARRQPLGALIELSPPALHSTQLTMHRLRRTLDHLDPLAAELRPGARALAPAARAARPALDQTRALLHELRPILRDARPTLDALRLASTSGVPLLDELDPTIHRLDTELLPWLAKRDESTRLRNYEAIGPHFSAVGSGSSEFNAFGNIIQFPVMGGPNSIFATSGLPSLTRMCRARVGESREANCPAAARLLQRLFGGKR